MSTEDITINFKVSAGDKFTLTLPPISLVKDAKEKAEKECSIPASEQRLVYRGKILKDPETLSSYGILSGHTIHLVRISKGPAAPTTFTTSTTSTTTTQTTPAASTQLPPATAPSPDHLLGALGGGGGLDGQSNQPLGALFGEGFSGMNPQTLQSLMSNPAITSMMQEVTRNPELIRTMLQANPFLNSIAGNPTVQSLISNPDVLRAAMHPDTLQTVLNLQQSGAVGGFDSQRAGTTPLTTSPQATVGNVQTATDPQAANVHASIEDLIARAIGRSQQQPQQQQQQTNINYAERYQLELQQLEDMGFINRDANVIALQNAGGDINSAVSWLLENGHNT